ncbi:ABC transporter ATP-binding protein [Anaerotignum sp. MB30-C6]|uniref:ABC transporter ATP-binding protein n=1 Tax=Anaerotignum sp. MB30-C6 TaxID=3070814 RepID=UPI0027DAF336|nr:ABC transporter ATP-binding protein [Anaerotignum sp. MB30-C6]WMI81330.1 ABC transporter ATP-binding protein [Anaerotignum sp. MB30-C6]
MSNKVLSVQDVTMQFGGVVAVNNLTLEVHKGEIVSLIGPNGAGKTTAFNVITGVYSPTNGAVDFEGNNIISNFPKGKMEKMYAGENKGKYKKTLEPTPDKITRLGIARTFQNIRLFKELTVLENVLIAKHMRMKANVFTDTFLLSWKEEKKMKEDSLKLLRILDLYDLKDEKSSSLPYGKQRHLEIARALATNPSLLLLDEPAAGLNPQETDELTEFIRRIRDQFNLTVFMIEHHMNLVMDISDRIYVIDFGKMIATGTPNEIQNNQKVIDAYLGVADDE